MKKFWKQIIAMYEHTACSHTWVVLVPLAMHNV